MYFWLILAVPFAILELSAVSRNLKNVEYFAKPAVLVCLFMWLQAGTGLQGNAMWFGWGILLSLLGDILLMIPYSRAFLLGLVAFLLAHFFYITGLRDPLTTPSAWTLILLIVIAVNVSRLLRRIAAAMRARGDHKLVFPIILYGTVISVLLYAALSTIYDPSWTTSAAFLMSAGAFLFAASDTVLAWNKFVSPVKNGHIWVMALYYLGQMGIVAGAISRFG